VGLLWRCHHSAANAVPYNSPGASTTDALPREADGGIEGAARAEARGGGNTSPSQISADLKVCTTTVYCGVYYYCGVYEFRRPDSRGREIRSSPEGL